MSIPYCSTPEDDKVHFPLRMSSLGWKLRRLRAMSAREVAMRVARAVRERVQPLPNEPPEATW